jgi:hypothetical protein
LTSGMERERLGECVGLAERPLFDAHRGERLSCLPRLCNTRWSLLSDAPCRVPLPNPSSQWGCIIMEP